MTRSVRIYRNCRKYEVYIDKNIFKPLEMHQTYFDESPYHLLRYRSHSYFLQKGKLTEAPFNFDTGITVSNGGLNSPFPDMQKYLCFLLGKPGQDSYDAILKRSSLEESLVNNSILSPAIPLNWLASRVRIRLVFSSGMKRAAVSTSGMAETKMAFSASSISTRNFLVRI